MYIHKMQAPIAMFSYFIYKHLYTCIYMCTWFKKSDTRYLHILKTYNYVSFQCMYINKLHSNSSYVHSNLPPIFDMFMAQTSLLLTHCITTITSVHKELPLLATSQKKNTPAMQTHHSAISGIKCLHLCAIIHVFFEEQRCKH